MNSLEINPTSVGAIVEKIPTPHLPHEDDLIQTKRLWNEAWIKS